MTMQTTFIILLGIQVLHSIEELKSGFHTKFPLFKMNQSTFLSFEIFFFLFWLSVLVFQGFPFRTPLMAFFIILMFANGVWHLVWYGITKKYVPGLTTAPLFVIVFLIFYFQLVL